MFNVINAMRCFDLDFCKDFKVMCVVEEECFYLMVLEWIFCVELLEQEL